MKFVALLVLCLTVAGCISDDVKTNAPALAPLNDTGVTVCMSGVWEQEDCANTDRHAQDGMHGRDADAAIVKAGTGLAGFDFTKRDATGAAIPDQAAVWQEDAWVCVEDSVTGLLWEVKSGDANAVRYGNHTYSWHAPNGSANGGNAGATNGGVCTGVDCDTAAYITLANNAAWCGQSDWRLPTVSELLSIADQSRANPPLDSAIFPNSAYNAHWTSQTVAFNPEFAWYVYFTAAGNGIINKTNAAHIRLVSGGLLQ